MNAPTRTAGKPSSDLGMLVGGVVADDEMDVGMGRHIGLDVAQGREELLVTMAGFALGDRAHAPMGCGFGLASQYLGDQLAHGLILDRAGPPGTHLIVEPLDPIGDEAFAPFPDRMRAAGLYALNCGGPVYFLRRTNIEAIYGPKLVENAKKFVVSIGVKSGAELPGER